MKKFLVVGLLIVTILMLVGCNKKIFDTTYSFDRAIIELPNGEIVEGKIDSWKDYDGEQLQIEIDGVTYLVSSFNTVLIAE